MKKAFAWCLALVLAPVLAFAAPPQYQVNLGTSVGSNTYIDANGYTHTLPLGQAPSGMFLPLQMDASGNVDINCVVGCGGGGGGGGGGAVTGAAGSFVDGWNLTLGTKADTAWGGTGSGTEIAIQKAIYAALLAPTPAGSNAIGSVSVSNFPGTQPVSGTFFQATQPVSNASLPLPAGAATSANQPTLNGDGGAPAHVTNFPGTQPVSGTFFQTTQPVSAATLPLPAGAATSAAQTGVQTTIAPGTAPASGTVGGCVYNATQPAPTNGQSFASNCDSLGSLRTTLEATTGTGMNSMRAVNTAASNMAFRLAVSPRTLYGWRVCNTNASAVYFHIYNAAANPPVPGTTVPTVTDYVAPTSCTGWSTDVGVLINNYIGYAVTSGSLSDSDASTVATANTVSVEVFYQ